MCSPRSSNCEDQANKDSVCEVNDKEICFSRQKIKTRAGGLALIAKFNVKFGYHGDGTCQTNNVFCQTIPILCGKKSEIARSIKDQNEGHPWQVKRVFQSSFEPSCYNDIGHTGGILGRVKYHHCSRSPTSY